MRSSTCARVRRGAAQGAWVLQRGCGAGGRSRGACWRRLRGPCRPAVPPAGLTSHVTPHHHTCCCAAEAPAAVYELENYGLPFSRTDEGKIYQVGAGWRAAAAGVPQGRCRGRDRVGSSGGRVGRAAPGGALPSCRAAAQPWVWCVLATDACRAPRPAPYRDARSARLAGSLWTLGAAARRTAAARRRTAPGMVRPRSCQRGHAALVACRLPAAVCRPGRLHPAPCASPSALTAAAAAGPCPARPLWPPPAPQPCCTRCTARP